MSLTADEVKAIQGTWAATRSGSPHDKTWDVYKALYGIDAVKQHFPYMVSSKTWDECKANAAMQSQITKFDAALDTAIKGLPDAGPATGAFATAKKVHLEKKTEGLFEALVDVIAKEWAGQITDAANFKSGMLKLKPLLF